VATTHEKTHIVETKQQAFMIGSRWKWQILDAFPLDYSHWQECSRFHFLDAPARP